MLNIALPKGRLGEKVYSVFEAAGFECPYIHENSRKLIFENAEKGVRYFWVKPSDVAIYVERGAADAGVVGSDVIEEDGAGDTYVLLDLGIAKCRMAVAGIKGRQNVLEKRMITAASKYPRIARAYFESRHKSVDIIKLNGSVELAPLVGLSDVIVDIVETGTTLKENGLEAYDFFMDLSARLICNKVSYKMKQDELKKLISSIEKKG